MKRRAKWMRLDNAAKIYPAARRRNWINVFRVSTILKDEIDPSVLQKSLEDIVRRFPSICVKVRAGMFWYYIEEVEKAPLVIQESSYPCTRMSFSDIKHCAFRVLYYKNRISTEFFHALTDGNGGMVFLKTLTAQYIKNKYNVEITPSFGVLDVSQRADKDELEDSFLRYSGKVYASRRDSNAYMPSGTPLKEEFINLITGVIPINEIKMKSKEYGVSITTYLCAVMIDTIQAIQESRVPMQMFRRPVKILIPVNLRNFYPSKSLRNFVLYITPGITPKMGHYSFEEIISTVHHQMGFELTEKQMNARIATNVRDELNPVLKIAPLFIKNIAMKAVYNRVGEKKACITISNLGLTKLPHEMYDYVERIDFVLSPQATLPGNCSVVSYKDKMYISFVRNIKEAELEKQFFRCLIKHGVHVKIESNSK